MRMVSKTLGYPLRSIKITSYHLPHCMCQLPAWLRLKPCLKHRSKQIPVQNMFEPSALQRNFLHSPVALWPNHARCLYQSTVACPELHAYRSFAHCRLQRQVPDEAITSHQDASAESELNRRCSSDRPKHGQNGRSADVEVYQL